MLTNAAVTKEPKYFPNLAQRTVSGGEPIQATALTDVFAVVDRVVTDELTLAGLPVGSMADEGFVAMPDMFRQCSNGHWKEVPTSVMGFWHRWRFERAWTYYRATGAGIPPEFAIPFDKEWGQQVRVEGDCDCRGAEFWGEGFAISDYHIDTPEGLKAFVELLNKIYKPRKSEE